MLHFNAPYTGIFSLKTNMVNLDQYPINVYVSFNETDALGGGSFDWFDLIDNGSTYEFPFALGKGQSAYFNFKTNYSQWSFFEEEINDDDFPEYLPIFMLKENYPMYFDSYTGTNEPVFLKFTPTKTGVYDIYTSEDPNYGIYDTVLEMSDSTSFEVPLAVNDDDVGTVLSRLKLSLVAGTTYYFSVYALNENGFAGVLNVKFLDDSIDTQPPTAPKNLYIYYIDDYKAILHWDASTDNQEVAKYEIYNDSELLVTTKTTSCSVEIQSNRMYSFKVKSKDAAGNMSQMSNTIKINRESYQYYYDTSGRIDYIKYSSGKKLKYNYDANGNILSIQQE